MIDSGVFQMKTARQLFGKLLSDYKRLQGAPANSELWFNFLVTADHLPEWQLGGDEDAARELRKKHALLRVCHYLAVNAKHFKAREPKPKAGLVELYPVARTTEVYIDRLNGPDPSPQRAQAQLEFYLELSMLEATELGVTELSALDLAGRLVDFWREYLAGRG